MDEAWKKRTPMRFVMRMTEGLLDIRRLSEPSQREPVFNLMIWSPAGRHTGPCVGVWTVQALRRAAPRLAPAGGVATQAAKHAPTATFIAARCSPSPLCGSGRRWRAVAGGGGGGSVAAAERMGGQSAPVPASAACRAAPAGASGNMWVIP